MAQGNWVQGGSGYRKYCWCAYVDVVEVGRTDTTVTYRVTHGYGTRYAIDCYANGSSSAGGSWNGSVYSTNNSGWVWVQCTSRDVVLARGNGDAYNHTFTGQINVTGGFGNGTSNASNTVTVPCRAYHTPHAPKNIRAERLSDTSAKVSWDTDYTGMNGDYPWSTVTVGVAKNGPGEFTDVGTVSWDTTSHTYNGLEPGCMYIFSAKATGPGGTSDYGVSAPAIYTTPTALGMLEAVKAEAAKVVLKGHDAPAFVDSWEFQLTTDGGKTWVAADVNASWEDEEAPAGTVRYRVRAVKSGLKGPWTESNEFTTICPPLAPSIRGVRAAYATGSTATLEWVPNHPDGSAQTSAEVQVTTPTGPTTTTVDGPGTSLKLPTGTKGLYTVRVRTKGLDEDWGAWSSAAAYTVADAPQAFFTDPAADGATLRAVPHTFTWKVADETGVSRQYLSLCDIRGNLLWSGTVDKDARSFGLGYAQHAFVNRTVYRVVLTVTAGSSLSVTVSRTFRTDWAPPAKPSLNVFVDDRLGCQLAIFPGAPESEDTPDTSYFTVSRVLPDGSTLQLGSHLAAGEGASDPLPPLNSEFEYVAVAYAATGVSAATRVKTAVASRAVAFNWGAGAEKSWLGRYLKKGSSRKVTHGYKMLHFADGGEGLPVSYGINERDVKDSMDFLLLDEEDYKSFLEVMNTAGRFWVRDLHGERFRARLNCSVKRSDGAWVASCDPTWETWEEPANG